MSAWIARKLATTSLSSDIAHLTDLQQDALNTLIKEFDVSTEKARSIVKQFEEEMDKGLMRYGATVAMIPSYVTGRPTGQEKGTYLALDLGGTNLRVCQVNLEGNSQVSIRQQKYTVSDALKSSDMRHLCDFIADCVDQFLTEHGSQALDQHYHLGFTFSFPVQQTAINRGNLIQWTKGFCCTGAIGKDVVVMLQDAFHRKHINVTIAALVNDTVGTLMAYAYKDPATFMGVIFGTGTNACYYEKMPRIAKWEGGEVAFDEMVVNMEWGAFDNERRVLPITQYDAKLDRESINPHQQIYEKLISGMYLGEIARNVIVNFIDRNLLFNNFSSPELNKQWTFETAYMSSIEEDETSDLAETQHILESIMMIPSTTLTDRKIVKKICQLVGLRAARISACGLAGIMSHTGNIGEPMVIAIDGSVYEFYPHFAENMRACLVELFGDAVNKVKFALARDGSGLGAGIVAMMAHKAEQKETV